MVYDQISSYFKIPQIIKLHQLKLYRIFTQAMNKHTDKMMNKIFGTYEKKKQYFSVLQKTSFQLSNIKFKSALQDIQYTIKHFCAGSPKNITQVGTENLNFRYAVCMAYEIIVNYDTESKFSVK